MSMTLQQRERMVKEEQARRIMSARFMTVRSLTSKCKTDDERYAVVRDSVQHDMIGGMIHGPEQA